MVSKTSVLLTLERAKFWNINECAYFSLEKRGLTMKIVGISACSAGIAHTYIAKQKLIEAAEKAGDTINMETQGTIGTEDALTPEQISAADVVLLAVDVKISGRERFEGKKVIEVSTDTAIKSPNKLLEKVHQVIGK
jgi:fructose PTS system EIIB component